MGIYWKAFKSLQLKKRLTVQRLKLLVQWKKAVKSYYHQDRRVYEDIELNEHLEIVSYLGNLSMRDSKPAIHLHINIGDRKGNVKGGHLQKGTIIFTGEFVIDEMLGFILECEHDPETALPLWRKDG